MANDRSSINGVLLGLLVSVRLISSTTDLRSFLNYDGQDRNERATLSIFASSRLLFFSNEVVSSGLRRRAIRLDLERLVNALLLRQILNDRRRR